MGKYPNSKIHELYSDWHWELINKDDKYKRLYVSDIDRLWLEYDFSRNEVVAVIDIKWDGSGDGMTATEKGVYDWFLSKGVGYYIVFISRDFKSFKVQNHRGEMLNFSGTQYADWLLDLRKIDYKSNYTYDKLKSKYNHDNQRRILV